MALRTRLPGSSCTNPVGIRISFGFRISRFGFPFPLPSGKFISMSREYVLQPFQKQVELKIDYARELNEQQHAAVTAEPGPSARHCRGRLGQRHEP